MAIPNTAVWRVRAGGSNVNGGGYDPSVAGVPSTTLNGAISAVATTVVVTSATGWPTSGNYYARIGNDWKSPETFSSGGTGSSEVVLITAGQGTTSWTVTRAQLGTVAQAFETGVVVDNELSRGNTEIASGIVGTSTASTTFTDAAAAFDSTYLGNVLWIASGAGATVGAYFIQSITNATTVVLDRVSGTYTAAVWKVGGAAALIARAAADPRVPGNISYVRSTSNSGTIASPDYSITAGWASNGDATNGLVKTIGENGRPYIVSTVPHCNNHQFMYYENLFLSSTTITTLINTAQTGPLEFHNCILDQNGRDSTCISHHGQGIMTNSECLSSIANTGVAGTNSLILVRGYLIDNCNFHDAWGIGVTFDGNHNVLSGSIVSKSRGISVNMTTLTSKTTIKNSTIDAGNSHAIAIPNNAVLQNMTILGTIISNHITAGAVAIRCASGSNAVNDRLRGMIDNNTLFNNTANAQNLTIANGWLNGHNYVNNIGTDPGFIAQSTQNYAIGATLKNLGFPQVAFLQSLAGQTTGVRNFMGPGAVQPLDGGSSVVINARPTAHLRR